MRFLKRSFCDRGDVNLQFVSYFTPIFQTLMNYTEQIKIVYKVMTKTEIVHWFRGLRLFINADADLYNKDGLNEQKTQTFRIAFLSKPK